MDAGILKQVRMALNGSGQNLSTAMMESFVKFSGAPVSFTKASNELDSVLSNALRGTPQLIGSMEKADDMVVAMSVSDLIELVAAARRQETFGEALDAIGFKPRSGGRIVVGRSRRREPLQRVSDA